MNEQDDTYQEGGAASPAATNPIPLPRASLSFLVKQPGGLGCKLHSKCSKCSKGSLSETVKGPRGARANGFSASDGHANSARARPSLGPSARAEERSDACGAGGEVGALGEHYRCSTDADGC